MMLALLGLYAVTGIAAIALARRLGRRTLGLAAVAPVATLVWLAATMPALLDGEVPTESVTWVAGLDLELSLRLDGFSALMAWLVAGVGILVVAYAASYLPRSGVPVGRLVGLLTLFAGSMLGLVLTDDVIVLYGFWELTGITSFLLIGNDNRDPRARAAALQALLVTGAGGLAMLGGLVVLAQSAGTTSLSAMVADPPPAGLTTSAAVVLVLLGAFTKSAQYPFHGWLPGAMVAPTPVSAYLHSATMVKAGVYLVARLAPAFDGLAIWRPLVVGVGVVTMIVAGVRALRQVDLKLLLAFGTVSQLGLMVAVFGWGTFDAVTAGCVLLIGHATFKAAAFMVVGILDHQHGTRDLRILPDPGPGWRGVTAVTVVAAASMAGLPLVLGFIGKEAAFEAFAGDAATGATLALAGVVSGTVLTVAYSLRFAGGALGRLRRRDDATTPRLAEHGPPGPAFVAPALVLAALTLVAGLLPRVLDGITDEAAHALDPIGPTVHLAVWHGVNLPLVLSLAAFGLGAGLHLSRRRLDPVWSVRPPRRVSAAGAYTGVLRGLNTTADRVTAVVQSGSMPVYVGVILATSALLPGALLLSGPWWRGLPQLVETPAHLVVVAVLIGAALAAATVRRRFTAALFLGVAGYAMAGLFVVQGAPDLALTQVAIETLTTVLFVLVLRRLPDRFAPRRPLGGRLVRGGVAAAVGATVFALALSAGGQDPATPTSDAIVERAYPDGEGRNIVNVILVEFRAFDTLGEITVLAAAAIGTVALARAGRRPTPGATAGPTPDATAGPTPGGPGPGPGPGGPAPAEAHAAGAVPPPVRLHRFVPLEVSMRIVFAAMIVGSLYLLFAGHNQPGGGFAGGIVAGAAVALRYITGGIDEVRRVSRGQPWTILGAGLLLATVVALVPMLLGGAILETASWTVELPLLGTVKATSALVFDAGVYLLVLGVALMVFESFGDDPRDDSADDALATAPEEPPVGAVSTEAAP